MTAERPSPHEIPDLKRARKLFFLSFEHSQGNTSLQNRIFRYLGYQHPGWFVDDDFKFDLGQTVIDPILNYALPRPGKPRLHPAEGALGKLDKEGMLLEISGQLSDLQEALNLERAGPPDPLELAAHIVGRDKDYLDHGRPRDFGERSPRRGPKADRWLSYFVYYGLEVHPTGAWEYDRLYADVVAAVQESLRQETPPKSFCSSLYDNLYYVITLYAQHHQRSELSPSIVQLLRSLPIESDSQAQ